MSTAMLVNLILSKLRTGRVEFTYITGLRVSHDPKFISVGFAFGGNNYRAWKMEKEDHVRVLKHTEQGFEMLSDLYTVWIEGVLNGKTRDEQGVLA